MVVVLAVFVLVVGEESDERFLVQVELIDQVAMQVVQVGIYDLLAQAVSLALVLSPEAMVFSEYFFLMMVELHLRKTRSMQ